MKILLFLIFCFGQTFAQSTHTSHWYQRNKQFNSDFKQIKKRQVIFLGNSITEGFDLDKFFPVNTPLNRGIVGDHIDGLLERLDSSVVLLKPSRIYLLIGINDIGRGDSDSLIIKRYTELLDRFHKELPGTPVFINSILPTSAKWSNCPRDKIKRLNNHIKKITAFYQYNWIDLNSLFTSEDGYIRDELTSDGLHLNNIGYNIWCNQLKLTGLN